MRRKVDKKAFGARVALRRKKLNIGSQGDLAKLVGMKQQGIGNIEKGKVARPGLLKEIADHLRTTEEWLLWEEGPEENGKPPPTSGLELVIEIWRSISPAQREVLLTFLQHFAAANRDVA